MEVLVWLIPIFPALAVLLNGLLGRLAIRDKAHILGVGSVGAALVCALIVILRLMMNPAEPIVFLRRLGDDDVFHRGPMPGGTLIVVPGIWASMPPPLLAATRARRACAATGRCTACGACLALATGTLVHEPGCLTVQQVELVPRPGEPALTRAREEPREVPRHVRQRTGA